MLLLSLEADCCWWDHCGALRQDSSWTSRHGPQSFQVTRHVLTYSRSCTRPRSFPNEWTTGAQVGRAGKLVTLYVRTYLGVSEHHHVSLDRRSSLWLASEMSPGQSEWSILFESPVVSSGSSRYSSFSSSSFSFLSRWQSSVLSTSTQIFFLMYTIPACRNTPLKVEFIHNVT